MDEDKLIQTLHNYERKVLGVLDKSTALSDICRQSGLKEVEAMRGLQWLENKGIIEINEDTKELVELASNGQKYPWGIQNFRLLFTG